MYNYVLQWLWVSRMRRRNQAAVFAIVQQNNVMGAMDVQSIQGASYVR
jgi:hypothetical protein